MIKIGQTNTKPNTDRPSPYNTLDPPRQINNNVLPQQVDRYEPNSAYTDDYVKYHLKGPPSKVTKFDMINKNYIFPDDTFKGQSNYNGSYKNNVDSRVRSQRVSYPQNEVFPKGAFKGNSSYVDTYVNKQGIKSQIIKHQPQIVLGTSKFQSTSSYDADYFLKNRVEANQRILHPSNFVLPKGQFAGNSTYDATYIPGNAKRTEQVKPREGELKVGGKFEGSSSYASEFDERNRVNGMRQKAKFIENDVMPKGQFKGDSTYQSNYLFNQKPTPSKLIKHSEELKVGGQFYGSSNYAYNFDNKGIAVRQKINNQSNNKILPQGKFQDYTTYTGHYVENPIQRNIKYHLEGQLKVDGGKFIGNSSYQSDYIAKQQIKQATVSYPTNEVLPRGDFVGNSTYTDNYIPSKIERRQQYRPQVSLHPTGSFQGNSAYTEHYDGGLSPAKYLTKLSNYDSNKRR